MPATLTAEFDTLHGHPQKKHGAIGDTYVLSQDAHVLSDWSTYEEAMHEGYRLLGLEPFFIREFRAFDQESNRSEL